VSNQESDRYLYLYKDADSNELLRKDRPEFNECTTVEEGFLAIDNETEYAIRFYSHDRCNDNEVIEDCPPGQQRSFGNPAYAYKAWSK
jgi:hypothetical protein